MIKRFTLFLLNILWLTAAVVVISAAVIVGIARLWLPGINEHRQTIAAWVSRQVNQPVAFDRISAEWQGWIPVIELNNFRLMDKENQHVITRFEKARMSIDLQRSFLHRQIMPGQLTVSGVQISLTHTEQGGIRVEGISPQETEVSSLHQNVLAYWLLMQRQLSIESAAITWHDERFLLRPVVFSNVTLLIRTDGEHRQLEGTALFPQSSQGRFHFILDTQGDLLTSLWSGNLYIEARELEPSTLLEYSRWLGLEMSGGELNFQVWSEWRNARPQTVTGRFQARQFDIGTHAKMAHLNNASGLILARREQADSWSIALDDLDLSTVLGAWPETDIGLAIGPAATGSGYRLNVSASFLRLDDIMPVLGDIDVLPASMRETLAALQPRGDLRELLLSYSADRPQQERLSLQTRFSALSTNAVGRIPGVRGLAGEVSAQEGGGTLTVDSAGASVDLANWYDQPLLLQALSGELHWLRQGESWRVETADLHWSAHDTVTELAGDIDWTPAQSPRLNLRMSLQGGRVEEVPRHLPKAGLPTHLTDWLEQALVSGQLESGTMLVRGALDRFPYDEHDGIYEVRLNVADGIFQYSPHWPRLEKVAAEIVFSGRELTVNTKSARVLNTTLGPTRSHIADVSSPTRVLTVEGSAEGSVSEGRRFVMNSPLRETLGPMLDTVADAGRLALKMKLELPLHPNDVSKFAGELQLNGCEVNAGPIAIAVKDLKGTLSFTREGFEARELSGSYLDKPVKLALRRNLAENLIQSEMTGRADGDFVIEHLKTFVPPIGQWAKAHKLSERMKGNTDWTLRLTAHREGGVLIPEMVEVASTLQGMALDLPSPLGKEASQTRNLDVITDFTHPAQRAIHFSIPGTVEGDLHMNRTADGQLSAQRIVINLGQQAKPPPAGNGTWIGGDIDTVSATAWSRLLQSDNPGDSNQAGTAPTPVTVNVHARRVEALGRWFRDVDIHGESSSEQWRFAVAGAQVEGELLIPHKPDAGPARINLKRLYVSPREGIVETPVHIDPRDIPAVSAHCDDFKFESITFGKADLSTRPSAEGLHLDQLSFQSTAATINATGEWRYTDGIDTSRFTIRVDAPEMSKLLALFGYNISSIEKGETRLDIDASWGGTPAAFTLEKLNGSLSMHVHKGRFLDIDPAAGRLFGLLSLQALPRRLLLDFNDLFKRGMSFDEISGTFVLDGGNAYTNNLTMEGPTARVEITGRTGLAGKDYDQVATVTPQLSDTFPLASAFFGPAGMGVGAAIMLGKAIFKKLPEKIDSLLAKQYTITGNWNHPVVERTKGVLGTTENG